MTARPIMTDPDVGIPDLVRRLTEDSKRLMADEVQLAKLETKESLHRASRGALWLALAFGVAMVTLVSATIMLVTLLGQMNRGHMWFGALITGIIELGLGGYLVKRGITLLKAPSYTLAETRHALRDTTRRAASSRS